MFRRNLRTSRRTTPPPPGEESLLVRDHGPHTSFPVFPALSYRLCTNKAVPFRTTCMYSWSLHGSIITEWIEPSPSLILSLSFSLFLGVDQYANYLAPPLNFCSAGRTDDSTFIRMVTEHVQKNQFFIRIKYLRNFTYHFPVSYANVTSNVILLFHYISIISPHLTVATISFSSVRAEDWINIYFISPVGQLMQIV